jgi:hypothetical protein
MLVPNPILRVLRGSRRDALVSRVAVGIALLVAGCATAYEPGDDDGSGPACPPGLICETAGEGPALTPFQPAPTTPDAGPPAAVDGGSAAPSAPPGPAPSPAPGTGAPGTSPPGAAAGDIPCDVATILQTRCGTCHGAEPRFGAPQALTTRDALTIWSSYVIDRVTHVQRPMPPPPNERLTPAEQDRLVGWLQQGAPAGEACDGDVTPGADDGTMIPEVPPPAEDCDHVVELTAHGGGGGPDAPPFQVARRNDSYVCFAFNAPWQATTHGLSFHPIVDDDRTLHHWLLYATDDASKPIHGRPRQHGEVYDCDGTNPGMALMVGWAPGGVPVVMPPDVGLEMPRPGGLFVLEIHYHNDQGLDSRDRSGVRLCASETLRPNTAATHWLGEERGPAGILPFAVPTGNSEVTGRCTPQLGTDVNVLTSTPHMHRRGTRMRTVIHRASGGDEILLDEPFDYQNQILYQTPNVIRPGDRLSTTCFFTNPGGMAHFGPSTDDEMCFNFVIAWPIGQLVNGSSLVGARHSCLK